MLDPDFARRWQDIRAGGIALIAKEIRHAQRAGCSPGVDPELTASALSAMLEHFCYVWQVGGGDRLGDRSAAPLPRDLAVDTLSEILFRSIHWRP